MLIYVFRQMKNNIVLWIVLIHGSSCVKVYVINSTVHCTNITDYTELV